MKHKSYEEVKNFFDYKSFDFLKKYVDNTPIEIRNSFSDDVFILIIGHLNRIDEILYFYKNIKNIIFAVDEGTSEQQIEKLKKSNCEYIIVKKPSFSGHFNINLQCSASYQGCEYLQQIKNVKKVIRMRSDQIILQLHTFINNFQFDKIGTICYCLLNQPNPGDFNYSKVNNLFSNSKNEKNLTYNYIMDYCLSGPTEELMKMFNYFENEPISAPAEHKLLMNYLYRKDLELNNTFEFVNSLFYFMMPVFVKKKIDFLMLKQDYHNWTVAIPLQPNIYKYE